MEYRDVVSQPYEALVCVSRVVFPYHRRIALIEAQAGLDIRVAGPNYWRNRYFHTRIGVV